MGGRGSASGAGNVPKQISSIKSPQTKSDFIARLSVIAELGAPGYNTVASVSDWEKYGKSRTYFKISAYRESDGKYHHEIDFGYYDNVSKTYNPSRSNSLEGSVFSASGSKATDKEIAEALKKIKKRK